MLKKLSAIALLISLAFVLPGCGSREQLLLLNWGEYISEEMVEAFEEEYNVDVIISLAGSNELFYSKTLSGTTVYDLVVPSDYMVEKMVSKNMLQKIDFTRLTNYNIDNPLMPGVEGIIEDMVEGSGDYLVPYFWGTFGLIYNKDKEGLEEAVKQYEWATMFESDKTPEGTKIGMYDVPRYAYAATMFYRGLDPNSESKEMLEISQAVLEQRSFDEWGDDALKKNVSSSKSLDLAFVYTGDFLDMLYTDLSEGKTIEELSYDIHIPNETIAFLDSLVLLKNARHVDLAYKFIDFFLRPEMMYLNASVVGYCTPSLEAYNMIVNPDITEETSEEDSDWLNQWKYAMETYYPIETGTDRKYKGTVLRNLSRDYLSDINIMVNNVKAN